MAASASRNLEDSASQTAEESPHSTSQAADVPFHRYERVFKRHERHNLIRELVWLDTEG